MVENYSPNCKIVQQKVNYKYEPFILFQEVSYADYDVCNEKIIQEYARTELNSMIFPVILGGIIILAIIFAKKHLI